ncbi:MAG: precorrin-3B synthase [Corynebacterium sp.]|nr:precorrin-3B synthase [Corynebacterium sp.]
MMNPSKNIIEAKVEAKDTEKDRDRSDQCPGIHKLHHAADGAIGRLRFPGGRLSPADLEKLATIAKEHGDGHVHATMRGNVQIRGIKDPEAFPHAVEQAGIHAHPSHELVRNIIASPYTDPELIRALDEAICAAEQIASLTARTLFGIDSGQGDILAEKPDFCLSPHGLYIAGTWMSKADSQAGLNAAGIEELIAAATHWAQNRGNYWRVAEHPDFLSSWQHSNGINPDDAPNDETNLDTRHEQPLIGWFDRDGHVDLGAGLPFGILPAEILSVIGKDITLTPWRSIIIHNLDEAEAEAVVRYTASRGLVYDARSPWLSITACTGSPGCPKSLSDVRADARSLIEQRSMSEEPIDPADRRVHFVGCGRRCGRPNGHYLEYQATGEGEYETIYR